MAYVITDACAYCGACVNGCPVDAITVGDVYAIDPNECIGCGECADACPLDAIVEK